MSSNNILLSRAHCQGDDLSALAFHIPIPVQQCPDLRHIQQPAPFVWLCTKVLAFSPYHESSEENVPRSRPVGFHWIKIAHNLPHPVGRKRKGAKDRPSGRCQRSTAVPNAGRVPVTVGHSGLQDQHVAKMAQ